MSREVQYGIRLTANAQGLTSAFGGAERSADRLGEALKRIGHYGAALVGFAGVAQAAQSLGRTADAYAGISARLKIVTASAEQFRIAQEGVFRNAQAAMAPLAETAQMYTRLSGALERLGGAQRDTLNVTEAVVKSLRISGATAAETSAAVLQFAQAMGSGVLRGDEFRSLMEAAPRLMQAVAAGMGITVGQLKGLAEQGKLTADVVGNALLVALPKLRGEFEQIPASISGSFQRVSNAFTKYVGETDQAHRISAGFARSLTWVADNFRVVGDTAVAVGAITAAAVGGRMVSAVASFVAEALRQRQALIASAEAAMAAAAADKIAADAKLAHAQRAVALASGLQALTVVQMKLIPAQNAAAAAAQAHAAAQAGLAATSAGAGVTGVLGRIVGLLGGPVGIIATLGLAAAGWYAFWRSAQSQGKAETVAEEIARLKKEAAGAHAASAAGAAEEIARLGGRIMDLQKKRAAADSADFRRQLDRDIAELQELQQLKANALARTTAGPAGAAGGPFSPGAKSVEEVTRELKTRTGILRDYAQATLDLNRAFGAAMTTALQAGGDKRVVALSREMMEAHAALRKTRDESLKALVPKDELAPLLGGLSGLTESFQKDLETLHAGYRSGRVSLDQYRQAVERLIEKQPFYEEQTHKLAEALKSEAAYGMDALNAAQQRAAQLTDEIERQREHNAEIGLSVLELQRLRQERLDDAIVLLRHSIAAQRATDNDMALVATYEEQIRKLRELKGLRDAGFAKEQSQAIVKAQWEALGEEAKKRADEFQRSRDTWSEAIADSLLRGFERGETFMQAFFNTLKNTARATILRPIIEPIVSPLGELGAEFSRALVSGVRGVFGGGAGWSEAQFAAQAAAEAAVPLEFFGGQHAGGIAGEERSFTRALPRAAFAAAERLHAGGIAADEVPTILQRGEGVFTPGQMRALGAAAAGGATTVHAPLNVSIDARGAAPGAERDIVRAIVTAMPGILKQHENVVRGIVDAGYAKRARRSGLR